MGCLIWMTAVLALLCSVGVYLMVNRKPDIWTPSLEPQWWGKGEPGSKTDTEIRKFSVQIPAFALRDLKRRLNNTRFTEDLENNDFQYGFQSTVLKKLVKHWLEDYPTDDFEAHMNQFPHYKTTIEGLDIHFVRVLPVDHTKENDEEATNEKQKKKDETKKPPALLLLHGWPGSFYDFYKVIPMLTDPTSYEGLQEDVFEVIVPSIPGYGFSEAPHRKGFDPADASRIFLTLMTRLGHKTFYVQGGDWGSIIATCMATDQPSRILGLHLNTFHFDASSFPVNILRQLVGAWFPSLIFTSEKDERKVLPMFDRILWGLQETGYLHLQATKPNTIGMALLNSPAGLAAYILEKYSTWTDMENQKLSDGGLMHYFALNDLLFQVMVYWTSGSISTSLRLYKEIFSCEDVEPYRTIVVAVPTGLACFPKDALCIPESFAASKYSNIVQYTDLADGGHFPSMQVPQLFVQDIWNFIHKVRNL